MKDIAKILIENMKEGIIPEAIRFLSCWNRHLRKILGMLDAYYFFP
jgi:hypothetical protein